MNRKHIQAASCSARAKVWLSLAGLVVVFASLNGCSRSEPVDVPVLRTVKLETVRETEGEGARFTGVVRQRQRAELAFESSGRLIALGVDVGDRVHQGQVLATLDGEPARQRLEQAHASAEAARAQRLERQNNYQRQQRLYAAGSVAQSVVEGARAAFEEAASQHRRATSDWVLARREVEKTQLLAPFAGRIVARRVDNYAQLTQGQAVLELESGDDRQVIVAVATQQADHLKPGDVAHAYTVSQPSVPIDLLLEGVSQRAENGLLQTCIFRLRDPSVKLSSGVTVLVQLAPQIERHLSIPVAALLVGMTPSSARVFVYQPGQGTVTLRTITIAQIAQGRALIDSGLAAGEQVATAGVAFLSDGQAVSLYQPLTRLAQE
ncbi:efflux RND transporter periplasmic adaptor subunit [Pseudomonas yamanorum]|uniref:efflux RND transporter periplasmic adaptor subunit n=1 Tax=Pseudomonas yamanorum TaxID=515393 RepID=UPI001C4675AA|nr:efflux RND transporter periplasmic adaptor subunit [Pseudomonas yamanorum]MBV6659747.1 efflux RND transporter periplasmic adaptor subunit [Pseudomonas yamanorum]